MTTNQVFNAYYCVGLKHLSIVESRLTLWHPGVDKGNRCDEFWIREMKYIYYIYIHIYVHYVHKFYDGPFHTDHGAERESQLNEWTENKKVTADRNQKLFLS